MRLFGFGPDFRAVQCPPAGSRMRVVFLLSALLLCVFSGQGAQQPQQTPPPPTLPTRPMRIQGTVRTSEGARLDFGVKVLLEGDDGHIVSQRPADSDGSFYFDNLHGPRFRIVVEARGFETHEEILEFPQGVHLAVCNVTLIRSPKDSDDAAVAEPRSEGLAPRNARKEYEKASKELAAQDLDKAKAHLERAVKLYPCYARAQTHMATVLEARHEPGAEAALRKAIECDPDYLSSYIVLGQMLNDQKRFAESVSVLEAGVRRAPSSWQVYYQLGVAYFGLEQYTKAGNEYQKVLDFNPSPPPELPLRLADIHLKEKAYDKAYVEMKQYLLAEPNGRFAGKVRGIMQQIDASGVLNHQQAEKQ